MWKSLKLQIFILSFLAFWSLSHGFEIKCTFAYTQIRQSEHNRYTCTAEIVEIESELLDDETTLTDIKGTHLTEKQNTTEITKENKDVEVFLIWSSHDNLTSLPKNLDKFFPNLISLQWWNGDLSEIAAKDLNFPNLINLGLHNNKLRALNGDLFKFTPKLQTIGFEENLIMEVGDGLLDGLSNLTSAYFDGNICIQFDATKKEHIRKLKDIIEFSCA
ncbi:Insulin-like growth factor-binding protein complex acid labile subunit [Pseudolycoriella hygida]|uniref:Insulin-like growth factor-binding protein complex acid labile subunit n=1 Tax=Pseudolycoriella hygida TaxID=35572 RepID=A0A9Q0N881_9DIPT|nr:Insulin-like growth factor-binding protein complex acid labile subunit [Pseudolycoriella hygida]